MTDMQTDRSSSLTFMKMHGLGNDFVVIDERSCTVSMNEALAIAIADRHQGVGFDQLATIHNYTGFDLSLVFWNADGSQSAACGNVTRCIARWEMDRTGKTELSIKTDRGQLRAKDAGNGLTSVNMGRPQLDWNEIPLSEDLDTLYLPIEGAPTATGMGNPHCTFFVKDAEAIDLEELGPIYEHHDLFPHRTNVQFASVIGPDHLRMRVWERGVGITSASGSSSCATVVAAVRRGLTGRRVQIDLDGGTLHLDWRDDGVWMTGPTAHVFDGIWRQ